MSNKKCDKKLNRQRNKLIVRWMRKRGNGSSFKSPYSNIKLKLQSSFISFPEAWRTIIMRSLMREFASTDLKHTWRGLYSWFLLDWKLLFKMNRIISKNKSTDTIWLFICPYSPLLVSHYVNFSKITVK